jgi:threonine/homoserine/homoserine lactone efflux protein
MVIVVAASATIQGKVILVNSVVMIIGNPKKYLLITSVPTTMVRKATNSAQMTLTILSRILKILSISTSTT